MQLRNISPAKLFQNYKRFQNCGLYSNFSSYKGVGTFCILAELQNPSRDALMKSHLTASHRSKGKMIIIKFRKLPAVAKNNILRGKRWVCFLSFQFGVRAILNAKTPTCCYSEFIKETYSGGNEGVDFFYLPGLHSSSPALSCP